MAPVTEGGTEFDPEALEHLDLRFWREVWDAVPTANAVAKGVRRAEFGPVQAAVVEALPEVPVLNLILGGSRGDAAAGGFLGEAIEWTRAQGSRGFALLTPGAPGTPEAEATLRAAGFEPAAGWMRFVRDAHPPRFEPAADIEVVELDGTEDGAFGAIAALGFGLPAWTASLYAALPGRPDWRCYLARRGGEPQACAAMLLDGGLAKLGIAATLEGGRRRGCQLALLRRRIEDAAAAGVGTLTVETGERVPGSPSPSYANILRAGFEEAYLSPGFTDARLPAG